MRRLLAAAFAACLILAGAAQGTAAVPARDYGAVFSDLADAIEARRLELPSPPGTKEEKAALKAWTAAGKAVDKALAKPSDKGFTKAAGKVEKILAKAFPDDAEVEALLEALRSDMVAATALDLSDLREALEGLPSGGVRDDLLEAAAAIEDTLDAAGSTLDRVEAHRLCAAATKALASVAKKLKKAGGSTGGPKGMAAAVDGPSFTAGLVEGGIVVDALGRPRYLTVAGVRLSGLTLETLAVTIDLLPEEAAVIAPGAWTVGGDHLVQVTWSKSVGAELVEVVDCTAGTINLTSIDPDAGTASGTFQASGTALDETPFSITGGTFNASGLVVTEEEL